MEKLCLSAASNPRERQALSPFPTLTLASVPDFAYDNCRLDAGFQPSLCPPESAVGSFGEKFRKQRELRSLSLEAISTATKIGTRMLRAIEDEHFDQLPGGVFNKGFVRAYARQVGLDEDEAVTDYLAALRESQIQSQTLLPNFRTGKSTNEPDPRNPDRDNHHRGKDLHNPDQALKTLHSNTLYENNVATDLHIADRRIEERRKETRRRDDRKVRPLEARPSADRHSEVRPDADRPIEDRSDENLDDVVPSSPLSFLNLNSSPSSSHDAPHGDPEQIEAAAPRSADHPSRRVPLEKLAAPLIVITLVLAFWTLHRRSQPAAASQAAPSNPSTAPVPTLASAATEPSAPANSMPVPPSHPAEPAPTHSASTPTDRDANPPFAKPHAHAVTAEAPPTFTLHIRATQTSWVSITADGEPVAKETLIAPANTSVRATHEIIVRAGNSAGISFLLNDKEIAAPGAPGEVRTYTFDSSGMLTSTALPAPDASR